MHVITIYHAHSQMHPEFRIFLGFHRLNLGTGWQGPKSEVIEKHGRGLVTIEEIEEIEEGSLHARETPWKSRKRGARARGTRSAVHFAQNAFPPTTGHKVGRIMTPPGLHLEIFPGKLLSLTLRGPFKYATMADTHPRLCATLPSLPIRLASVSSST